MPNNMIDNITTRLMNEYPQTGESASSNVRLWLSGELPMVPLESLRKFLKEASLDAVHEAFWRNIPFGTGGVRGTVGFGPNRINRTVVALTIQAHCKLMNSLFSESSHVIQRRVVVANDVRRFLDLAGALKFLADNPHHADNREYGVSSRSLAYLCAEVYAANGFSVYMIAPNQDDALLTTPELSFLIRRLRASGGINLSASHNHPDDNGIKVYDENGGQYLPPRDEELTKLAAGIRSIEHMSFRDAVTTGLINDVPADALSDYMDLYIVRARHRNLESQSRTRVVFTPLNGCGERTVGHALQELNYSVRVPDNEKPDGTFNAIPLLAPNPEVEEATSPAKLEAEAFGANLVLAADPDADRLGVEVYHHGQWHHLTGNQIATILAYHLLLDPEGPLLQGAVYETIVTTLAVKGIAERAGCEHIVDDLLVGFKYIGEAIRDYEQTLDETDDVAVLAFATEESHGFLDTPRLRDKDAMSGALHLAKLHERLERDDRTLIDYLASIYRDVGQYGDRGRSISISGSVGVRAISDLMDQLRTDPPSTLAGVEITRAVDYWDETDHGEIRSGTDREARNVIVLFFDGGRITLRPSGTEPKLKMYVQTTGASSRKDAQEYADELCNMLYRDLLLRLGYDLEDFVASLPDVIWLDAKIQLQHSVLPRLIHELGDAESDVRVIAAWLKEAVEELVPGQSAWEIALPALRAAAGAWDDEAAAKFDGVLAVAGV